jgi:hypothetical protein
MMTIAFDFDIYVWANMRRSVRQTGTTGWWYKILSVLLKPLFDKRAQQLDYIYSQLDLDNCPDDKLYLWGQRLALPKLDSESFADWRWRLRNKWYRKEGISLAQKIRIIADMSGVDVMQIKWYKIHPYDYRVGDPVGSRVTSRDYSLCAYRIYLTDNGTTNWSNVAGELAKIEKGSQFLELWVQKPGATGKGIFPDDSVTTAEREYEIY